MRLTRIVLALVVATSIAATLLLTRSPQAVAKGKPGGGGQGDTNFAFVFEVNDKGLFLTTIDDSNRVQLTRSAGTSIHINPRWSPDLDPDTDGYQGLITYAQVRSDADGLYVIKPDGTGNRLLGTGIGSSLAWVPNGREIVSTDDARRLVAIDVATGDVRVLWDDYEGNQPQTGGVTISPLGMLAFHSSGTVLVGLYSLNNDGRIEVDSASVTKWTSPETWDLDPSFSPDGMYLAYSRLTEFGWEIRVQDLSTGDEIVVMDDRDGIGGSRRVTWSPDGSQIATYARLGGRSSLDLVRINDWYDPASREFILVTQTDSPRTHEVTPDWMPGWQPQ